MAFTQSLDHSCSIGGARFQAWTLTGDGSDTAFDCGLERAIACWVQNQDDTVTSGVSVTISGGTITFGRVITNTKIVRVFVIGE